jgi:hypothetical protein
VAVAGDVRAVLSLPAPDLAGDATLIAAIERATA